MKFEYEEIIAPLGAQDGIDKAGKGLGLEEGDDFSARAALQTGIEGITSLPLIGQLQVTYGPDPNPGRELYPVVLGLNGPGLARTSRRSQAPEGTGIIVTRASPFPIPSDTIDRFSSLVAQGDKRELLRILGLIQPTIKDIEVLSRQNIPSLWADIGDKPLLPVEALGGGVVRVLALFVNLFAAKDGLIVIDEIENGIHHSALPRLWQQILRLSDLLNVQCVVTTHSLECVRAAARVFEDDKAQANLAIHQMHPHDADRRIETYTDEKLMAALELGYKIR